MTILTSPNTHEAAEYYQDNSISSKSVAINLDRPAPLIYKIGIALFYIPFGFDFKDRGFIEGSNLIRAIIVILSLSGFIIAFFTSAPDRQANRIAQKSSPMFFVWTIFLIYLIFITLVRSPIDYNILRGSAPYIFMLFSMILLKRHLEAGYAPDSFWTNIVYMGLISTVWTFYFGRFASSTFNEEDAFEFIDGVRYSILSSALLPFFAITFYNIARFKNLAANSVFLAVMMFLFLIAKSRGMILGIFCTAIYAVISSPNRSRSASLISFIAVLTLLGSVLFTLWSRNLNIIDIWAYRFGVSDRNFVDVTWYTRLAEYVGQFNLLFSDIQSAVFGYGFLKQTYWDPYIFDTYFGTEYSEDFYLTLSVGGHSTWVASLFQGGLIIGSIPLITLTYLFISAMMLGIRGRSRRGKLDHWGGIGLGIITALWFPINFGSFFGDRILPMIVGAAIIQSAYELNRLKLIR